MRNFEYGGEIMGFLIPEEKCNINNDILLNSK